MNNRYRQSFYRTVCLLCMLGFLLSSCATSFDYLPRGPLALRASGNYTPTSRVRRGEDLSSVQERILAGAEYVKGKRSLVINGRRFNWDCTGTILSIYYYAGIDLQKEFADYTGNGVTRLYKMAEHYGLLYDTRDPVPGDVIFWDNTYDRNHDGKWNDLLTHAGVVVATEPDGTIEYIHHNYRRGIVVEKMNLHEPDATDVNSPLRMKSDRWVRPDSWLSSHLYRDFGMLYDLPTS